MAYLYFGIVVLSTPLAPNPSSSFRRASGRHQTAMSGNIIPFPAIIRVHHGWRGIGSGAFVHEFTIGSRGINDVWDYMRTERELSSWLGDDVGFPPSSHRYIANTIIGEAYDAVLRGLQQQYIVLPSVVVYGSGHDFYDREFGGDDDGGGPVRKEVVDGLDKVTLTSADDTCALCLEDFEDGMEVTRLPCLHVFHGDCVVKWLWRKATCPLCRYRLPC